MKNNNERYVSLLNFEEVIDYKFKDINILNEALTHSSYANEHKRAGNFYNERLEFLGDSVLSLIISDYIYKKYPQYPEGELTKLRATAVCESTLAYISKNLKIGHYLLLGKGEETTGGRDRISILADALEALIGAIYLDGGLDEASNFILDIIENEIIKTQKEGELFIDYKTKLQEILQKTIKSKIEYYIEKEVGPDHDKKFFIIAVVDNETYGRGWGRNKKEAEQMAAKEALIRMGVYCE